MRLNDREIIKCLNEGKIVIDPRPDDSKVSGISVDLTLGREFRSFRTHRLRQALDLGGTKEQIAAMIDDVSTDPIVPGEEGFSIPPGGFALGATRERVRLSADIVGWLDGRSSLARLGLMVHATAHRIDPGWDGNIVLEFCNAGPLTLVLREGMSIGALNFEQLSGDCEHPYNKRATAKYKDQTGAVTSRIDSDKP